MRDYLRAQPSATRAVPETIHALGASERLFVALRRFTATNVVRMIALSGALLPATIREALVALQRRHPLLNVQLGAQAFEPVLDARIPLRVVARTGDEAWRTLLETLLNTPLPARPGPLLQVHYLYSVEAQRSELFVVGDHAICDGVSINALCAELLALCAGALPLPPRPRLLALDRLLPAYDGWARGRAFGAMFTRFAMLTALRGLTERRTGGRTTRFASVRLSREATSALVARARSERTTVTAALMSAVLLAVEGVRATPSRLALSVPVNLRPHLPAQQLEPADLGHYTNVAYLAARRGGALWPRARTLKRQLTAALRDERLLAALPSMYRAGLWFVREHQPPFAHALISSSGVVPVRADYGAFRAIDFVSGTSAAILSADFGFFANTFDGRLRINLLYLEEVVTRELAERALADVCARLAVDA